MTPTTTPRTNAFFVGVLILCALLAIFLISSVLSLLKTFLFVGLVLVGLYEGCRFLASTRGRVPPPSSLGVVRGAGRIGWMGVRSVPAFVRWGGRTAYVMAHSTQEIAIGAVLGGIVGLAIGLQFGMLLTGILLGLGGGVAFGTYVGKRRLRAAPVSPAVQSRSPGS